MVYGPSQEVLDSIRNPPSGPHGLSSQIAALKQLKNDIVGHDQRKELVVKQGIVGPLVGLLKSGSSKQRASNVGVQLQEKGWSEEDEAQLQATLILGCLANGGRPFVDPLVAAAAVEHLVNTVVSMTEALEPGLPQSKHTERFITATLQALRSLAGSASTENGAASSKSEVQIDIVNHNSIQAFQRLLLYHQPSANNTSMCTSRQQQLRLTCDIIAYSASSDTIQSLLTISGLLDTLASFLAISDTSTATSPTPFIQIAHPTLTSILRAISAIISGSNFRVQSFMLSPAMRSLTANILLHEQESAQLQHFQLLPSLHLPAYGKSVSFYTNGNYNPTAAPRSQAFPALGSLQGESRFSSAFTGIQTASTELGEHISTIISWLIHQARTLQSPLARLVALKLLAQCANSLSDIESEGSTFFNSSASLSSHRVRQERERQLAYLAVPLAVKLVQDAAEGSRGQESSSLAEEREMRQVKEDACSVLALLIESSKELQAAAVDAGAVKRVCPLLKKTFDAVVDSKPLWSSAKSRAAVLDDGSENDAATSTLGPRGLAPELQHVMRVREGALMAIAALAKSEDIHRKAIVDSGVVPCIIDSLKTHASNSQKDDEMQKKPQYTNTIPVLLAACAAAQSLSRSVSLLRTSLIDAGIAKPVFELLRTAEDMRVKVKAVDVACNLLLDFSPMREDLLSMNAESSSTTPSPARPNRSGSRAPVVVQILASHARQSQMELRLSSLWALKHLVLASGREIKMGVLEELGTGWLVGAIQGDQSASSLHTDMQMTTGGGGVSVYSAPSSGTGGPSGANAAGEQVELLNPPAVSQLLTDEGLSMDMDADQGEEDDENAEEDEDGEVLYEHDTASGTRYQYHASSLRSTLAVAPPGDAREWLAHLDRMERDTGLKARRDDVAVQEQALDFVRNLLNGEDVGVMFEILIEQIGAEKIFTLLGEKLAPLSLPSSSSSSASQHSSARPIYQPTELILSTIHVLTHVANSTPRHKNLLIAATSRSHTSSTTRASNPSLLSLLLPHFQHPDRRVRVICVWTVNNLIWCENEADRVDTRRRVEELKRVGIVQAVYALREDGDLDVRERVRTAVRSIEGA